MSEHNTWPGNNERLLSGPFLSPWLEEEKNYCISEDMIAAGATGIIDHKYICSQSTLSDYSKHTKITYVQVACSCRLHSLIFVKDSETMEKLLKW